MPWYDYSPGPGLSRPLITVRLWHGSQSIQLIALVDSGADASLLDAQYADLLGLDRSAAVVTSSTGASGESFEPFQFPSVPLELQFENERFPFLGSFIDFPPHADGMNLLGRTDFFAKFIVQFWDQAEMFNIDLSPDFSLPPSTP